MSVPCLRFQMFAEDISSVIVMIYCDIVLEKLTVIFPPQCGFMPLPPALWATGVIMFPTCPSICACVQLQTCVRSAEAFSNLLSVNL